MLFVCSDSHGCSENIKQAVSNHSNITYTVSLGDGINDYGFDFYVKGNCDDGVHTDIATLNYKGKSIFLTHGHQERVKLSIKKLVKVAKDNNAHICMFGHTHIVESFEKERIFFFNPGTISDYTMSPTYFLFDLVGGVYAIEFYTLNGAKSVLTEKFTLPCLP